MIKTILKETILMILTGIVILLIFSIILYDDIPVNKVTPNKVAYSVPENLQEELEETITEEESKEVLVTYTITEKDLQTDEARNYYDPGKVNPFSEIKTENNNNNNNNETNNNNTTNSGSTGGNKTVGSNSTGNLYEDGTQK